MGMETSNPRPKIICGQGRTKQSFKSKVNINSIIAKHRRSGMIDHVNGKKPFYGDVSAISDYKESLEKVIEARNLFNGMSSKIRNRFKNDPNEMITFLQDESNLKEAQELGMVAKPPLKEPAPEPPKEK